MARFRTLLSISWTLVFGLAARASAENLDLPMRTPRLIGLTATLLADGGPMTVSLALGFDDRGRLMAADVCRVGGDVVDVRGVLKERRGVWAYKIVARGTEASVSLKITGAVGDPEALFKYRGPQGKLKSLAPVALDVPLDPTRARIALAPQVDCRGRVSGSGRIVSGFGNDGEEVGVLRGKVRNGRLSWSLKQGRRKVSFRGDLVDGAFVGALKVKVPPEKGVQAPVSVSALFASLLEECSAPSVVTGGLETYFPLRLGSTWQYREASMRGSVSEFFFTTDAVTAIEADGDLVVESRRVAADPGDYQETYVRPTAAGLVVTGGVRHSTTDGDIPFTNAPPYFLLLPEPLETGSILDVTFASATGGQIEEELIVEGFETITVDAGTFAGCVRIVRTVTETKTVKGMTVREYSVIRDWFAPAVGRILSDSESTTVQGDRTIVHRELLELVRYDTAQ